MQKKKPRPARARLRLPLLLLLMLLSLQTGCATGSHYDCPAPALKTWTRAQELQLADELERAEAKDEYPMMRQVAVDYNRMRRQVRACQKGKVTP